MLLKVYKPGDLLFFEWLQKCILFKRVHALCTEAGELCLVVKVGVALASCGSSLYSALFKGSTVHLPPHRQFILTTDR